MLLTQLPIIALNVVQVKCDLPSELQDHADRGIWRRITSYDKRITGEIGIQMKLMYNLTQQFMVDVQDFRIDW